MFVYDFKQSAESVDFIMSDFYHFYSYVWKRKEKVFWSSTIIEVSCSKLTLVVNLKESKLKTLNRCFFK